MHRRVDAVIIGGGPAGALAALHLARQNWRTIIIERRSPNGGKTCGHCLHRSSFPVLERAGLLDAVRRRASARVDSLRVNLPSGKCATWRLTQHEHAAGLVVDRRWFDQLILDEAARSGATVLQGTAAREVQVQQGDNRVTAAGQTYRAPLLVGADGLSGGVARVAGINRRRSGRKYGFSFALPIRPTEKPRSNTVEMFVTAAGYLGVVGHGSRLHVAGLVNDTSERREPLAFVQQCCDEIPALRRAGLDGLDPKRVEQFFAAGPIPMQPRDVASDAVALVGDAAGYVEPFTGEGMSWALHSAEALAEVTRERSVGQWDEQAAGAYRARWHRRLARRHNVSRCVAWALQKPRIMAGLLWALTRHRLSERVVQQVSTA